MSRAGRYRDRVALERKAAPDGASADENGLDRYGNPVSTEWSEVFTLWGNLREATGKERLAAGRLEAPATATLRVRRSENALLITAEDRVRARGHVWAITAAPIDPDGRRQDLEFTLERGGAVN